MRVCTRCGMTNYTIYTCFKKHGYPPHRQQQGQVNNVSIDHDQEDEDQPETSEEQFNDIVSDLIGFTPAQHKVLLALFPQSSTSHGVNHPVTQLKSNAGIICTILNQDIAEFLILDTRELIMCVFLEDYSLVWKEFLQWRLNYLTVP